MEDKKLIDCLLRQALSAQAEPEEELNQKVLENWKETGTMKIGGFKKFSTVVLVALAIILLMSVTVLAARGFLSPNKVAENLQDNKLALAFTEKNEIKVNQSVTDGGYIITLLGVVNGEKLSQFGGSAEERNPERTFVVVAIENEDGTPMPNFMDEDYGKVSFFVSPLIKGQIPWQYNIFSMGGSHREYWEEGVIYRIIECDGIEMFADRGLYICVSTTFMYSIEAFDFNPETGEITPREDFEGTNVLFDLPLDPALGDYERAEEYLKTLWE